MWGPKIPRHLNCFKVKPQYNSRAPWILLVVSVHEMTNLCILFSGWWHHYVVRSENRTLNHWDFGSEAQLIESRLTVSFTCVQSPVIHIKGHGILLQRLTTRGLASFSHSWSSIGWPVTVSTHVTLRSFFPAPHVCEHWNRKSELFSRESNLSYSGCVI